jgi:enediyne biosynthesis protein E3
MISTRGRLRRRLFGIRTKEVTLEVRGFPAAEPAKRDRLERIGREFLAGYHVAMEEDGLPDMAARLDRVVPEFRGFAYEGAAMALALRAAPRPGRASRLHAFLAGPADAHVYTAHVGVGWAWARLPAALRPGSLDPLLRWLAFDGMGFHDGYFHPRRVIEGRRVPAALRGYERSAFDQGVGRCLWFYGGADPDRAADAVDTFDEPRRSDLWSGVGIACAYAGGADEDELTRLRARAGRHAPHLAQGAAFGVKAHARAGHAAESAALASGVLCGVTPETAAAWCDDALPDAAHVRDAAPESPAYETWRASVRRLASPAASRGPVPEGRLP